MDCAPKKWEFCRTKIQQLVMVFTSKRNEKNENEITKWCYNTYGTVTHPAHDSFRNSSCHPSPFLTCLYLQSLLEARQGIVYFFTRLRKTSLAILEGSFFSPFLDTHLLGSPWLGCLVRGQLQDIIFYHSCPHYPPIWSSVKPKTRDTSAHSLMEAFFSHYRAVPVLPSSFLSGPFRQKRRGTALTFWRISDLTLAGLWLQLLV